MNELFIQTKFVLSTLIQFFSNIFEEEELSAMIRCNEIFYLRKQNTLFVLSAALCLSFNTYLLKE